MVNHFCLKLIKTNEIMKEMKYNEINMIALYRNVC